MITRRKFMAARWLLPCYRWVLRWLRVLKNGTGQAGRLLVCTDRKEHELRQVDEQVNPGRRQLDHAVFL